jgi:hypothetical protein
MVYVQGCRNDPDYITPSKYYLILFKTGVKKRVYYRTWMPIEQ